MYGGLYICMEDCMVLYTGIVIRDIMLYYHNAVLLHSLV